MTSPVRYERDAAIATITLDRPAERNAVNLEVCDAMYAALQQFEADTKARVAILTGTGPAFCAGADLTAFAAGDGPKIAAHRGGFGGFVRYRRTKPVVAAINGHALAGGLELVLACEMAVASNRAMFGLPEVTVGLMAGGGGAIRLPVDVPPKIAFRMLLTGKPIDAAEALQYGLINQVVDPDDVMPATLLLAQQIAAAAPLAVAASLRVGRTALGLRDEANAWCVSDDVMDEVFATQDAREGVGAFVDKRHPTWTAR
ncbi:enoyl-CoA hydratase/isomerase family protein [Mycobacterium sp. OAE908]|uniref:enoyl-CoA hydratase-related protein n=1 Tax=Mycobacterium sp. OAE908 TaxID=2817899 RepID=UPI001AE23BCD